MDPGIDIGIAETAFVALEASYRQRFPVVLTACDTSGRIRLGPESTPVDAETRLLAIHEAMRWGEPVVLPARGDQFAWAAPLTHNARLLGGLVASVPEDAVFPTGLQDPAMDVRHACRELLQLACEAALCDEALLRERRAHHLLERRRAEAIHELKSGSGSSGESPLVDETALVAAVRSGDRGRAREIINRRLVAIYPQAGAARELTKARLLELVVILSRAAVESGGKQDELLGSNFSHLLALGEVSGEEALSAWLRTALDRIMDSIERHRLEPSDVLLRDALAYMEANCCDEVLGRDEVARRAGLAPARFSRLMKERLGRSFTDHLNHLRISHAKRLLEHSGLSLLQIAYDTGFSDPSYFTKVFRRHAGMTPRDYRSYNRGR